MASKIFQPAYEHYNGLPNENLLFNPLIDVPSHLKERDQLTEFYKLSNEFYSPEFGARYLLRFDLYPYQMAIIRAMLMHKFPMLLMTRGGSKSTILAVYAVLHAIFYPGTRIVLVSASYRQAKNIFNEIKRTYDKSPLLRLISKGPPVTSVDRCYFEPAGSYIVALPLGQGGKIRGERGHVILADEIDEIPADIFDIVVRGFAAVEANPFEKTKTLMMERKGIIKKVKTQFSEGNKIVLSGTAGFKCGTFYKMYNFYNRVISNKMYGKTKQYNNILGIEADDTEEIDHRDYCIVRFRYDELPAGLMEKSIIQNAKASMSKLHFGMEYETEFGDDSLGYFKMKDIEEATAKPPDGFMVQIKGKSSRPCIIAVDPARTKDRFSICVIELGSIKRLVYQWSSENTKYADNTKQIRQIMRDFNIIAIGMDAGGGGLAVEELINSTDCMKDGDSKIYRHDNEDNAIPASSKILYMFDFTSEWLDESNALLQKNIEDKSIMFPQTLAPDTNIQKEQDEYEDILGEIINLKRELTSIEISYTKTGKKHFDLMPVESNKGTDIAAKHKDRYSSFLIGNYLATKLFTINADPKAESKEKYAKEVPGGYIEDYSGTASEGEVV